MIVNGTIDAVNKLKRSKVQVAPSKVHGLGVFTLVAIKKDKLICEYTGVVTETLDDANQSPYILKVRRWHMKTKKREWVYLDGMATDQRHGAG